MCLYRRVDVPGLPTYPERPIDHSWVDSAALVRAPGTMAGSDQSLGQCPHRAEVDHRIEDVVPKNAPAPPQYYRSYYP
jgi:hypothetical protein